MKEKLKKMIADEKKYCESKLRELQEGQDDGYPTEYLSETPAYWKGRIDQLDFALGWLE